jgi:hypothetical protein
VRDDGESASAIDFVCKLHEKGLLQAAGFTAKFLA